MNRREAPARKAGRQKADIAEQTKADIIEAALHCFATSGYNSTTLRDIADRARTTHGLIRHHFGSKENLWKCCVAFVTERTAEVQLPLLEHVTPENAIDSFKLVVRALVENAAKYPDLWRLLAFEALKDSERLDFLMEIVWPVHQRIAPLFEIVQEQGYLQNFDNDSFFLFVVCLGAIPFAISPFSDKLYAEDIFSEEQRQMHTDLVIDTLIGSQVPTA